MTSEIPITTTSLLGDRIKPGSLSVEKANLSRYLTLSTWQYLVILGIAISGLAAFVNTYDAITGIDAKTQACEQTGDLGHQLNVKFIIVLVLSCIAVVLGIVLAWFFRAQVNQHRLMTLGITTGGIFGILYALSIKFVNTSNFVKLGISWASLLAFLLLGFFLHTGVKIPGITGSA